MAQPFGFQLLHTDGAARAGDEVHDLFAPRLVRKSALYAVNLSPKSTNARQQLFLIANCMAHTADYSIPTHPIVRSQALFLGLSSPNHESGCYHTLWITGRHKDTRSAETCARSGRGLDPCPCNDGQPDG